MAGGIASDFGLPSAGVQSPDEFVPVVGCQLDFSSDTDIGNGDGSVVGRAASPGVMTGNGCTSESVPIGRIGGSWSVVPGTMMGVGVMVGRTIGGGCVIVGVGVACGAAGWCTLEGSRGGIACVTGSALRAKPWAGMFADWLFQIGATR
jgi:hypothetical protein